MQIEDYVYLKSSLLIKNTTNEYIISGGRNLNLNVNDLVLNEEGFVIGYLTKIFDDHSLISTLLNSNFSIPGIDKHGNEYLITSNKDELLINSISIKEQNVSVDYIFTDIAFDHPGKFPIVDLSQEEVSQLNNKISSTVKVNYRFSFDSNIYIVKKNETIKIFKFCFLFIFILIFELFIGIITDFSEVKILPFFVLIFYISTKYFSNSFVIPFFLSGIYYDAFYTSNYFGTTSAKFILITILLILLITD